MKQDTFFCFGNPHSDSRSAWWTEEMQFALVTCPLDDSHQRGGARVGNLSVILPNKPVQDFVWTWTSECLIQDHILNLFRSHGLTGFDVKPVKAQFEKPATTPPPLLWELVVTGWGGIALERSGIRLIWSCEGCGDLKYSDLTFPEQLIDESQWDGSDVFMVWPLPRFILVTQRVAKLVRDHRLTGAVITPVGKINTLFGNTVPFFCPGRLSYWMPKERARQLGGPLGIY